MRVHTAVLSIGYYDGIRRVRTIAGPEDADRAESAARSAGCPWHFGDLLAMGHPIEEAEALARARVRSENGARPGALAVDAPARRPR